MTVPIVTYNTQPSSSNSNMFSSFWSWIGYNQKKPEENQITQNQNPQQGHNLTKTGGRKAKKQPKKTAKAKKSKKTKTAKKSSYSITWPKF